jgi:adenine-specific DNA-methyltransferase
MEKLKMHSPDLVQGNIAKIAELFPNCVTEAGDEYGKAKLAIDFDLLRQELAEEIVDGPTERFNLNWPGKRRALLAANAPIASTLRPAPKESRHFSSTRNLYIEGDNLAVVKLLQESYLGKVDAIYIDPPYNTGNDFVYSDKFAATSEEYLSQSAQTSEEGERMVANLESNGRFHSDWLSMIYSRLKLARNLLCEQGLIFISIDDVEAARLKILMDEVFGAENFVACIAWEKRYTRSNNAKMFYSLKDTILVFRRSSALDKIKEPRSKETEDLYTNPDNDPRGVWTSSSYVNPATKEQRPNLAYVLTRPSDGKKVTHPTHAWKYSESEHQKHASENRLWWGKSGDTEFPRLKNFLNEMKSGVVPTDLWSYQDSGTTDDGGRQVKDLFDGLAVFDNPKPTKLIARMLSLLPERSTMPLVMDFFSGSASTAHAIMEANAVDGKARKFILVQLQEECNKGSVAASAGFKRITDLGKERIRRAGSMLKEEHALTNPDLDVGFRVLKVDSSNMKDVYYSPDAVNQDDLFDQVSNIKEDRKPLDLLFQVLIDWGVDLSLPIEEETIEGKQVFFVDTDALAACFDSDIDEAFVKELASRAPRRAVFRDASYRSDSVKINVEQIFKLVSPKTALRCI